MCCRFTLWVLITLTGTAGILAQQRLSTDTRNFVGRVSTGWNYYSKDASLSPELSAFSTNIAVQYRWFDPESGMLKYRVVIDYYERNALASPTKSQFDNRYVIRQLYGAYGTEDRQIRAGKLIPQNPVVDAYPINGAALDGYRLAGLEFSAFGGSVNDFYDNKFMGTGYNYGGSLLWREPSYYVGAGFSSEKFNSINFQKAFFSTWYKPLSGLQVSNKTSYIVNRSLLAHSLTNAIYKPVRSLTLRLSYEFYNRTSVYIPPTDTINDPNRYFFSSREQNATYSMWLQVFRSPRIGDVSLSMTAKKRFGNNDLIYGSIEALYHNHFFSEFTFGLNGSYTSNQWLNMARFGALFEQYYIQDRLGVTINVADQILNWKSASGGRAKNLISAGFDLNFRISRAFVASVSFNEEFGNAFDPRSNAFIRLSYSFR